MTEVNGRSASTILTWCTALVAGAAGVWTFLDPGLLHGPEAMQGSARGTALVLIVVAVPVLLVASSLADRGRGAALVVWCGALLYIVYNAALFLFLTPFNAAFLLYVTMLSAAVWSVGLVVARRDLWALARGLSPTTPVRGIAAYVWVVVVLNAAAWLARIVPALNDSYPSRMLDGTGVETNVIYVQDLAIWLPLAAVAASWLRRREPRGVVVVGAVLGMWVIESLSIAVDQWFGAQADPTSAVVSSALVLPFLAVALIGTVPVWLLLRGLTGTLETHRPTQTASSVAPGQRRR